MTFALPEEIIERFRVVAVERIAAIEGAWAEVLAKLDDAAATLIHRELHTLKGESHAVGFKEVNLVCHKLEDLLEVARARGYAVDEDFDLVVNMALRFMVMLIKKKPGNPLTGVDLPGFIGQIDAILRRHDSASPQRHRPGSVPPRLRPTTATRLSPAVRQHLAPVAVETFLEYAVAKGVRRDRLRGNWHALRDLVGIQRAMVGGAQLEAARASAAPLAQQLGKQIELKLEVPPREVTTELLGAIDVAAVHLVRNAIDHGIETPAVREAAGKPPTGTITVRGAMVGDRYEFSVADDGAGIDAAKIVMRAIDLGFVPGDTQVVSPERLVDLLCRPGFSTRLVVNEISGRGVGLDAVRGAALDNGGTLTATFAKGAGTTWTMAIPIPSLATRGHLIRAPGLRFPVVIDPSWEILEQPPKLPIIVDIGQSLGFMASTSISTRVFWMTNGTLDVGLVAGNRPAPVEARRLLPSPASCIGEVISLDGVEGIFVRPERIPGVA